MLRYFLVLLAAIGLLPAVPGGNPDSLSEIVTQPGYRHALGDGFEVEADGRVRAILLLADGLAVEAHLLSDLGPGIQVHHRFGRLIHGLALSLDAADLPALRAHPAALGVYPDVRVRADLAQSGPLVGAPQVWTLTDGAGQPVTGLGVRVAVVDTGVDYTHPALGGCLGPGCKVVGGYDFVHDDGDPLDDHGHGSHVAGIVAADGLLRGVAPGAEILAYKVLNDKGEGYASNVIAALEQAVADGADVINLSLGGPGAPDDPLSLAAQAAVGAGCIVVAAAGNGGPGAGSVEAPAIAPDVIAVAAADKADLLADFSSRGPVPGTLALKPDLTAPGVAIGSTSNPPIASLSPSRNGSNGKRTRSLGGISSRAPVRRHSSRARET